MTFSKRNILFNIILIYSYNISDCQWMAQLLLITLTRPNVFMIMTTIVIQDS